MAEPIEDPIVDPLVDPIVEPVKVDDKAPVADVDSLRKELKKKNNEAENLRNRLKDFEKAEEERKNAALSEADRLKKDLEDAQKAKKEALEIANKSKLENLIGKVARNSHLNEELALSLIANKIDPDSSTLADDISEEIKNLISKHPNLVEKTTVVQPAAPTNPGKSKGLTREEVAAMTPREVQKNWDKIAEFLKQNK